MVISKLLAGVCDFGIPGQGSENHERKIASLTQEEKELSTKELVDNEWRTEGI
jgi:hypothetical protein